MSCPDAGKSGVAFLFSQASPKSLVLFMDEPACFLGVSSLVPCGVDGAGLTGDHVDGVGISGAVGSDRSQSLQDCGVCGRNVVGE